MDVHKGKVHLMEAGILASSFLFAYLWVTICNYTEVLPIVVRPEDKHPLWPILHQSTGTQDYAVLSAVKTQQEIIVVSFLLRKTEVYVWPTLPRKLGRWSLTFVLYLHIWIRCNEIFFLSFTRKDFLKYVNLTFVNYIAKQQSFCKC